MGIFEFFRKRHERESALGGLDASVDPAQAVDPLAIQVDSSVTEIHGLGDIGKVIGQLHQLRQVGDQAESQFQAQGQVLDLRGTSSGADARKEVFEVLRRHGVDPAGGGGAPSDPETLQRDIMAALQRSGIDLSAYGMVAPTPAMGATPDEPGVAPIDPEDPDSGIRDPLR